MAPHHVADALRWHASPPLPTKHSGTRTPSRNRQQGGIVVFSGGSAANSLVDVFSEVAENNKSSLSYVIPISDNGGSSSELIRVFGGPGIGDVRMNPEHCNKTTTWGSLEILIPSPAGRLVRLIPDNGNPDSEIAAIKVFFNHRLPKTYSEAKHEWSVIIEAQHPIWTNIGMPKKELIRSFLNTINMEIVKRLRPSSRFDFSGASIGNLFLTGARLFTGNFESAIYLLSSICSVPATVSVIPAINTNFAQHISAGLSDGTVITGQNNISHPSAPSAIPEVLGQQPLPQSTEESDTVEDANLPGTLPTLRKPGIKFSKAGDDDLPARIERLWYINPYGQEIKLPANPRVLAALESAACIIYSIGSLFTSIVPSLILKGVGDSVADPRIRSKILILNGTLDRETGPSAQPLVALDFVAAIAQASAASRGLSPPEPDEYWHYVTHVVYLECPGSPVVDKIRAGEVGIECMRVYGRQVGQYDAKALSQALEVIVGRKDRKGDRPRRKTLER